MENCSISLTIPEAPLKTHEETIFDIWALKSDRTLDIRRLNWNSKPPRGKHLGTFSAIGPSTQQTPIYTCPSGTYQHVEMSCRQGPCHMHILASGQKEFSGTLITLLQESNTVNNLTRIIYDTIPDNLRVITKCNQEDV